MNAQGTEGVEEHGPGGLSRRDLITRTAVAGGLLWAAPVLMASPASAQECPPCPTGEQFRLRIASAVNVNCQTQGQPCLEGLRCGECLVEAGLITVNSYNTQTGATITLSGSLAVASAAAKFGQECVNVACAGTSVGPTTGGQVTVAGNVVTATPGAGPGGPLNFVELLVCVVQGTPPANCPAPV